MITCRCQVCGKDGDYPDSLVGGTDRCGHCGCQTLLVLVGPNPVPQAGSPGGIWKVMATRWRRPKGTPDPGPLRRRGKVTRALTLLVLIAPWCILALGFSTIAFHAKAMERETRRIVKDSQRFARSMAEFRALFAGRYSPGQTCPYCREPIRYDARRCPHCQANLDEDQEPSSAPSGLWVALAALGVAVVVMLHRLGATRRAQAKPPGHPLT